jgi:hypothetical protein
MKLSSESRPAGVKASKDAGEANCRGRKQMSEHAANEKPESHKGKIIAGGVGAVIGAVIGYGLLGEGAVFASAVVLGLIGAALGAVFD